jgi:hypothetical protein
MPRMMGGLSTRRPTQQPQPMITGSVGRGSNPTRAQAPPASRGIGPTRFPFGFGQTFDRARQIFDRGVAQPVPRGTIENLNRTMQAVGQRAQPLMSAARVDPTTGRYQQTTTYGRQPLPPRRPERDVAPKMPRIVDEDWQSRLGLPPGTPPPRREAVRPPVRREEPESRKRPPREERKEEEPESRAPERRRRFPRAINESTGEMREADAWLHRGRGRGIAPSFAGGEGEEPVMRGYGNRRRMR